MTKYGIELSIRINDENIKKWRRYLSLSNRPLNSNRIDKIKECENMLDMLELEEIDLSKMLLAGEYTDDDT